MHADISRTTFDPGAGYRSVVLQQGRVTLDADVNEQAAITAHHDEVRTRDILGRVGGPRPDDPKDPGPFAIWNGVDDKPPKGTPWSQLVLTPGRYYIDGVLVEAAAPDEGRGWPLGAQPFFGLGEPSPAAEGARYALYLEVGSREVTADEQPRLLESALGGPDTTTRVQTYWQVKSYLLEKGETCKDLGPGWLARTPRKMIADLDPPEADADPCRIGSAGGYRRLENQLYRVQIHTEAVGAEPATFLWSRENGSVVAGLTDLVPATPEQAWDATVSIDRTGRDPELSIEQGDLVELTSATRELSRLPGILAIVDSVQGLELQVRWVGAAAGPVSVAEVGTHPLVRRWDGKDSATQLKSTPQPLEDGIRVSFPDGGEARIGDYWQIPARAVRLAYGISQLRGTIEWPPPGTVGSSADPLGPVTHVAPLGIIVREGEGWTLEHDCRSLFPPLTGLITLDLVGGDGQEDLPGEWLDEPVRTVVRNGPVPVVGVSVVYTASDGGEVSTDIPPAGGMSTVPATTVADGVAAVRWKLNPAGPTTQTLTARRTVDGIPVDVPVVVTARLAVATEVAYAKDGCEVFVGTTTVAGALDRLAERFELRLQGGDGQLVLSGDRMLRYPVRVIVDSACGPVEGVGVIAHASDGAHVRPLADPAEIWPGDIDAAGSDDAVKTGPDGSALFWWAPNGKPTDTLELRIDGDERRSPIVVTAQRGGQPAPGAVQRPEAAHIEKVLLRGPEEDVFGNDIEISGREFGGGTVIVVLDQPVHKSMAGKPVLWVELDLPWPTRWDGSQWTAADGAEIVPVVGYRTVRLDGKVELVGENMLAWAPTDQCRAWLGSDKSTLWGLLAGLGRKSVDGRLFLNGTATVARFYRKDTKEEVEVAVNTHVTTFIDVNGRVQYKLIDDLLTDDLVAGGTYMQWFRLTHP